ncbi:hypothetical protein [Collinsella aerofaciens]|nr:hypothetical protein [Collinsella aerofaciens]
MNHSKVYEMRMLLDNTLWKDSSNEKDKATSGNAEIHAKGETKVPIFPKFTAQANGNLGHEKRTKMIDTFEYINTVSRMLADIKRNCLDFGKEERSEGDLVYIDNVRLSLLNEDEVRTLITVMSGTFDGITIPEAGGLDVGHLFQSFIKSGTSFKLIGRIGDEESSNIILKIPIDGADLFESGYSVDDLLIGKVGIIGICKGKVKPSDLRSSYEYYQTKGKTTEPEDDGFINGSSKERTEDQVDNQAIEEDETEATYIDVIAVIQAVNKKSE